MPGMAVHCRCAAAAAGAAAGIFAAGMEAATHTGHACSCTVAGANGLAIRAVDRSACSCRFPGLQEWGNPAEKEYYDYMKSYRCSGEGA